MDVQQSLELWLPALKGNSRLLYFCPIWLFQCQFTAGFTSTLLFAYLIFPRFWNICQKTSMWACFIWSRLLQLAEAELNIHRVPCRWWNAPPLHFQHNTFSTSLSCSLPFYLSYSLPWFSQPPSLLHMPCFFHLLFFSVISSCLSLSSLFPSLPFLWSPLSSPHLPIISLPLSSSSCLLSHYLPHTLLQSLHHPLCLSLHVLFPLRHSLLGTLYSLSSPLAASVHYFFVAEAGQTERTSPLEDVSPNSHAAARCRILKPRVGKLIVSESFL